MSFFDFLIDAYIDANILLVIALGAWGAFGLALKATGLSKSPSMQVSLLRLGVLTALAAPLLMHFFAELLSSVNLADLIIAQYLQGNIALSPAVVEGIVDTQQRLSNGLGDLDGRTGGAIVYGLFAGFFVFGFGLVRNALNLRRTLRQCYPWRRFGNLHLILSDTVAVPFATRSLRRRYIVLPSRLLCNRTVLRISIAHEAQHLRNGDVVWGLLFACLRPLFFWNPAFAVFRAEADRLGELACDRAVLRRKRFAVADYCDCLLQVGGRRRDAVRPSPIEVPAVPRPPVGRRAFARRAEPMLRQRVLALLDGIGGRDRAVVLASSALLLIGIVGLSAASIHASAGVSTHRLHLSTMVNRERMAEDRPQRGYNLVMAYWPQHPTP